MKICVLNASNPGPTMVLETDSYVDYRMGRASCFEGSERVKQCSSWHSWAYALESEFFVIGKPGWERVYEYDAVIILVNRDMELLKPLVRKLGLMKKKTAISFHEGVQDLTAGSGVNGENVALRWIQLVDLVKESTFYINIFGQMVPFFEGLFGKDKVKFCSHAIPSDWNHGFSKPLRERKYDFLIGTRTFNQRLSRNTLASLATMNRYAKEGCSVHYLSEDGDVSSLFGKLGFSDIVVHKGPLSWTDWLKMVSDFRFLVHHDTSSNLGQIVYDASLVDVLTLGSTTWNAICLDVDDGGSLKKLDYLIHHALTDSDWLFSRNRCMKDFKNDHSPNHIRWILESVFQ
jgi:hypothetical protein